MFTLSYALRQWRKNKLQTLILVLGLSLFCTFTVNLVATAPGLFNDRQSWMSDEGRYATLGLEAKNGRFNRLSKQQLDTYRKSPAVDEFMMITNRSGSYITDEAGNELERPSLTFLPDNFVEHFRQQLPVEFGQLNDNGVLISYDFWQKQGRKPLENMSITFTKKDITLPVVGLLPEGFRLFRGVPSDIVLTRRLSAAAMNIDFGDNPPPQKFIDSVYQQMLERAPMRFGIASLKSGYSASDVTTIVEEEQKQKQETEDDNTKVVLLNSAFSWDVKAIEGVQFTPSFRQQLVTQWWMLFGLTVGFLMLGMFNLLTSNFSHYLQREQEFQTRQAIGATSQHLLRQLLVENATLGALIAVAGSLLSLGVFHYVERELTLVTAVDSSMVAVAVVTSALLVLLLATVVGVIPFVLLNREARFSRSKSGGQSVIHSALNACNMAVQVSLAFVAISCAVSLWLAQQERLDNLPLNADVEVFKYSRTDSPSNDYMVNLYEWHTKLAEENFQIGYSYLPLVSSSAYATKVSLESAESPDALPMQIMTVSPNYFSVLGVSNVVGATNPSDVNKVLINRTAAMLLGVEQPQQAIGQQIYIDGNSSHGFVEDSAIIIDGIIEDIPHSSLNQIAQPMIYNKIANERILTSTSYVLIPPKSRDAAKAWLQQQVKLADGAVQLEPLGSLRERFKTQDKEWFLLAKLVLGLTILVCGLAATSLYQQVVSYLIARSRRYAVMQAVGAQLGDIAKSITLTLLPKVIFGLALGLLVVVLMDDWFRAQFYAQLLTMNHVLISCVVCAVLVIASYLPGIWRQLRRPIQRILHEE